MKTTIPFIALSLIQFISIGQKPIADLRQITSIKVYDEATLVWTASGETTTLPYVIEQFRWNKWIKIGEVDPHLEVAEKTYQFKAPPHSGENVCRVKPTATSTENKEIRWTNPKIAKVKFTVKKSEIEFSDEQSNPVETMFEIIDSSGALVKRGWAQKISCDNLPKGLYTLNYDNQKAEFKL